MSYCKRFFTSLQSYLPYDILLLLAANTVLFGWYLYSATISHRIEISEPVQAALTFTITAVYLFTSLFWLTNRLYCSITGTIPPVVRWLLRFAASMVYVVLFSALNSMSVTLSYVVASLEHTISVSTTYLQLDTILGLYEPLTKLILLTDSTWILPFLHITYLATMGFVYLLVLFLWITNSQKLREYTLAIAISFCFSLMLWVLLPALAPIQFTHSTIPEVEVAQTETIDDTVISNVLQQTEHTAWQKKTMPIVTTWDQVTELGYGYAISSNPSMHIIWSVLIVWYAGYLGRTAASMLRVVVIGGMFGTIFFLQHYSVDVLFGFAIAVLAIKLAPKLSQLEARNATPVHQLLFAQRKAVDR